MIFADEEAKAKPQQHRNSAAHKLVQSPPEKKANVSIFREENDTKLRFQLHTEYLFHLQGTVFYENTLRSDASANITSQMNRKSVISSQSTGSSNNEVITMDFHMYRMQTLHGLEFGYFQTTGASSSTNKNYQASYASSRATPQQHQQLQPGKYRSSMSSHSDIFMKADEQKINFGWFH